jgi:Ca-activated chloride channel family protein
MKGFRFTAYVPPAQEIPDFERLFKLFTELLHYAAGDAPEALSWMNQLDKEHHLTTKNYGMGDFIEDLKKNGYLKEDEEGRVVITPKSEQTIRKSALDEIFGKLKKTVNGNHKTSYTGMGDELSADSRPYAFGDPLDSIDLTNSIHNAQVNHGIEEFRLTEEDLEVREKEHKSISSTVLMIDISHSMILYGEDRITPARKVALALTELVHTRYPKDKLDIIVFGNDAWPIEPRELPYLEVGPYHTNTVAGLDLAMDILRRRKTINRQIFMITDGKPTCLKEGNNYYKNSFGLDRKIVGRTLNQAAQCRRLGISITTFMIASDPYLQEFVREFTEVNNGRAFYSSLDGLGEYIFEDYIKHRKKRVR